MVRAPFILALVLLSVAIAGAQAATRAQVYLQLKISGSGGAVSSNPTGDLAGCTAFGYCLYAFAAGSAVTLSARLADPSIDFAGWLGACSGSQASCSLTMDQTKVVRARFVCGSCNGTVAGSMARYVHALILIQGHGLVRINNSRSCSVPRCTFDIPRGQQIAAVASQYSRFVGWNGACSGALPQCQFGAIEDPYGYQPRLKATFSP